ncbi:DNA excision repair protein ERCC-1 [Psilocybe cubensis]|uniref:DNA excision repair protein ERCC-1 n=1 Tax=Psilocybe cubensis TaxID=181762 RepID=A0ACB8HCR4_PSICU|nr:DNA excision repair protein ERCC-1 [Psilocybe cubensis]KAH9485442.1 DNA excision repair protein ERCC-1 [Psilocybe cubensis]
MSATVPPVVIPASANNIIVNTSQRGNPVLECVRNVGKEFGDIVADYQVGRTTGVLFLRQDPLFEEAGHYLTTYKQYEFKSPELIKERAEKDYRSILRSALISISKVNKTDVETLRTSFGSFGNISKATSGQLHNLPGFGQVKVKNIKNAFEKPFRNQATGSLISLSSQAGPQSHTGSGMNGSQARREGSPVWDIELDLDNGSDELENMAPIKKHGDKT